MGSCGPDLCNAVEDPVEPLRNDTNESESMLIITSADGLEFYQLLSKVKIGEGTCQPKCLAACGVLEVQGWCDECEEKFLKGADCSNIEPGVTGAAGSQPPSINPPGAQCCFIDTKSQGWYDISCSKATSGNLIAFDSKCHLGAQMCEQKSNIVVRHKQKLTKPSVSSRPSINWIVNDLGIANSADLIRLDSEYGVIFDYVAEWNPDLQVQTGSALGNIECLLGGKKMCTPENIIVTGPFKMEKNMPYFVSVKTEDASLTYAGPVPGHLTFELKKSGGLSSNYIILPLDTTIKTAKQICDDTKLGMRGTDFVGVWDVQNQRIDSKDCDAISSGLDFDVYPGQVYYITIPQDTSWTQI